MEIKDDVGYTTPRIEKHNRGGSKGPTAWKDRPETTHLGSMVFGESGLQTALFFSLLSLVPSWDARLGGMQ